MLKNKRNNKGQWLKGVYVGFGFKPGIEPWNKNVKGIHLSKGSEFKKGLSPWNKGKKMVKPHPRKGKSLGYINTQGYRVFYIAGKEHLEHRMVMESYLGRKLLSTEIVHHIDHDRTNNSIFNLEVMTRSQHTRLHKLKEI